MIKDYLLNRAGSLAPIFGLGLPLLLLGVGVAIDFAQLEKSDRISQDIADSMVLAAAGELAVGASKSEAEQEAIKMFEQNSSKYSNVEFDAPSINITKARDRYTLTADVTGNSKSAIMSVFGKGNLGFYASAESEVEFKSVEIALVVDVSWSMNHGKIEPMKDALEDFFEIIYPSPSFQSTRKISLIPYADTVHFGNQYRRWLKPDDPPTPVTMTNPDGSTYVVYRYLKPRNSELYVGCFQHEPNSQIQSGTAGHVRPGNYLSYVQSYQGGTPRCPSSRSQVHLFEGNVHKLKNAARRLELGFGTSTDIGTMWGWRALSPSWAGTFSRGSYPKPFTEQNIKHLIILTDGKTSRSDPVGDAKNVTSVNREPATSNFTQLCDNIKRQNEISVTTIAYGFSDKEAEMRPLLENCVAKDGQFYEASTRNVANILASIAKSVTEIRLIN